MNEYTIMNLLDLLDTVGEDEVKSALSDFSCPKNTEIETFLHRNAIDFAKRKLSITHLIFNSDGEITAYFTLAHKPSNINARLLSKTSQKKLASYARWDASTHAYNISAFLIAQFGKNYKISKESSITGNQLMDLAINVLQLAQRQIGGGVIFLECEDRKKLLSFYQNEHNRFQVYGERYSEPDQIKYLQLMRFF